MADNVPVLLVRVDGEIKALHNRCTHRGGSLADGELEGNTITCPLHGSVFNLDDGSVERGPAAYPAPLFEARESGGKVEVRRV
jgi:nitrite reductase/ring-hydroxylating ferredoxin subunit